MAIETNSYEEARKQRLEDNKKIFEDLGISTICKSLSTPEKQSPRTRTTPKSKVNHEMLEPRRSLRARNLIDSYTEEASIDLPPLRKRFKSSSSTSCAARSHSDMKVATYEERAFATQRAEDIQNNLKSGHPSFVKSMLQSHVYRGFWLGLPAHFCKHNLPLNDLEMVLEDENGLKYDTIYLGSKSGLSGGWRAFALDHKLDDGDAVIFELTEPARFKVYIVRADADTSEAKEADVNLAREEGIADSMIAKVKENEQEAEPVEVTKTGDESILQVVRQQGGLTNIVNNGAKNTTKSKKAMKVPKKDNVTVIPEVLFEGHLSEETNGGSTDAGELNKAAGANGDSTMYPELQTEDNSEKFFRKRSSKTTSKLFRRRCA